MCVNKLQCIDVSTRPSYTYRGRGRERESARALWLHTVVTCVNSVEKEEMKTEVDKKV